MTHDLPALMDTLSHCAEEELRTLWKSHVSGPCPEQIAIRRSLLAWRVQAQVHGGLSLRVRQRLQALDKAFRRDPNHRPEGIAVSKVGTEYVRHWNGVAHRVEVVEGGYQYQDTVYRSLSEIARTITGTRWSGPKFFGLKSSGAT